MNIDENYLMEKAQMKYMEKVKNIFYKSMTL